MIASLPTDLSPVTAMKHIPKSISIELCDVTNSMLKPDQIINGHQIVMS